MARFCCKSRLRQVLRRDSVELTRITLDLSWLRSELAPHYSSTGRPSIDPKLMIRMLVVGYVFAIRSERLICREGQPTDNPVRASRLRRTPLTPSSGDTTYPVPSIQVTAQEQDMNAPPNIDPVTAHSDSDVVYWLTNDTRDERFIDNIFAELCVRLQRAGIPVKRASLHVLIYHPQWLGARIMWADGMREAELARVDYDVRERSEYIDSPANEIHDGATEVRDNLERDPSLRRRHAVD